MSRATRGKSTALPGRRGPSVNLILTIGLVVLAVLVVGGILLFNRSDEKTAVPPEKLVPAGAHTLSTVNGNKVTLVEFLDFQCPACASYYTNITKKVEQDYQGRITFVPRNFPLEMHPLAVPAARAAEAAGRQGKYNEMYHALYNGYREWAVAGQDVNSDVAAATAKFEQYATTIGLDVAKFRTDVTSPQVQTVIDRGIADGREVGVDSTPTFFVNGEKFEPTGRTLADVDRQLREKLDQALAG
ncbi:DsbA family protein [Kibdelosporangium phytohabitans]|uniref:Disulfide bond formation protein DsbA n=1 Tax=Kibdelosporangium phytohabitans TaxID=860235 RepID=A0A0N9HS38_9PSEU|nr:thioredoxin domain-containing protein [Kibdelosporangium phytohabitans]ALG10028.1 disulfide bond formation protein DsbA [Kibdelosporangium phytohabitans]MBE1460994.1 protein-disulfide isomerase [Kibdelosporangium phytohabitans]